jgi:hypothetical protein
MKKFILVPAVVALFLVAACKTGGTPEANENADSLKQVEDVLQEVAPDTATMVVDTLQTEETTPVE